MDLKIYSFSDFSRCMNRVRLKISCVPVLIKFSELVKISTKNRKIQLMVLILDP